MMRKSKQIDRRTFLERGGKAAGFAAVAVAGGMLIREPERHPFRVKDEKAVVRDLRVDGVEDRLVVVRGEDPARMTAAPLSCDGRNECLL
jgi:hypothetical protein